MTLAGVVIAFGLMALGAAIRSGLSELASAIRCYPHVEQNAKKPHIKVSEK